MVFDETSLLPWIKLAACNIKLYVLSSRSCVMWRQGKTGAIHCVHQVASLA